MELNLILKRRNFTALIFILFVSFGCKKSSITEVVSTSKLGSVSGSFAPSNAATLVSLDTVNGGEKKAVIPDPDGKFKFDSVLPGNYKLRITPTRLYYAPSPSDVNVTSGINTPIPIINLTAISGAQTGSIIFSLDGGTPYIINNNWISLTYSASVFNLKGSTPNIPSYYSLDIKLNNVNTSGLNNIPGNGSYISLFYYTSPGNAAGYWSSNNGGFGSVTITSFDPITRSATGNFAGRLVPQGATIGTKIIDGSFTNVIY